MWSAEQPAGPGSAAARFAGQTLCHGVLLQSAMGTSEGVSGSLSEEPLPFAARDPQVWADSCVENRDPSKPHDGGRALGLSRNHYLQELGASYYGESRRGYAHQEVVSRPGHLSAGRATTFRNPAGALGFASF